MKYTIKFTHDKPSIEVEGETLANAVSKAVMQGVSLSNAILHNANLQGADLTGADLRYADLRCADLRYATLYRADMNYADINHADLRNATLRYANLYHVDLRYATLEGADLDHSCLPLWCGSLEVEVDKRLAVQAFYHACRWLQSVDDDECNKVLKLPEVKTLANKFHRVDECEEI